MFDNTGAYGDFSKRYLAIYLNEFSIELLYRSKKELFTKPLNELSIALYTKRKNQLEVVRLSEKAKVAGIYEGMSLAVANTLCSDLLTFKYDLIAEFSIIQKVAVWCLKFSPVVGIDDDYLSNYLHKTIAPSRSTGLVIDLSGTQRLHRGEDKIIREINSTLNKRGFSARIAISNTIASAWAHSRFSTRSIFIDINSAKQTGSIHDYPITALRLSEKTNSQLDELGISSIQQLLTIPRKSLTRRFGPRIIERLEEIDGQRTEFIQIVIPPLKLSEKKRFEIPLNSSLDIAICCGNIYKSLCISLSRERKIPKNITVRLYSDRDQTVVWQRDFFFFRSIPLSEFSSILLSYIETNRYLKDISMIEIKIIETDIKSPAQLSFNGFFLSEQGTDIGGLLSTLTNKLGRSAVNRAELYDSHLPEKSIGFESITSNTLHSPTIKYSANSSPIRPSIFFHPGHPVNVLALLPDHPPKRIYLGRHQINVKISLGPEKIDEAWFLDMESSNGNEYRKINDYKKRDYFRICDSNGRWLWLCHHRSENKWSLCGMWV